MKNKKISYFIIFAIIVAILTGIFTGCGKKEPEKDQIYDEPYYAFEQTYPAEYDSAFPEEPSGEARLLFKTWPADQKGKMEYRIYNASWVKYTPNRPKNQTSVNVGNIANLVNEESESYFNIFFLDEDNIPREDFRFVKTDNFNPEHLKDESSVRFMIIPHDRDYIHDIDGSEHIMAEIEYTFTKESDDGKVTEWSGYCCPIFSHGIHMDHIIVFETETEIFAESRAEFDKLLKGFRKTCW